MASTEAQQMMEFMRMGKPQEGTALPTGEELQAVRAGNDQMMAQFPISESITVEEDGLDELDGEFYRYGGEDKRVDHFLLYFHGGGYENGTVKSRRFVAANLAAAAKVDAFSLDYTQWPEGKHPVALTEAVAAFDAVLDLGFAPENIAVGGESAGAMLTLALVHWLKDNGRALPGKIVTMGPVLDIAEAYPSRTERAEREPMLSPKLNEEMRYFWEAEDLKSPYISARYGDFHGFPEAFITVGTEEILYDDAVDLHHLLDEAGVKNSLHVYDGLFHTFQCMPMPESFASIAEIGEFLRS